MKATIEISDNELDGIHVEGEMLPNGERDDDSEAALAYHIVISTLNLLGTDHGPDLMEYIIERLAEERDDAVSSHPTH
jgi:hypothetical protein